MYTRWCSIPNHTYAVLNSGDERVFAIKGENEGFFGGILNRQLPKPHLRKCKIIGGPLLGERLDNGTWTGNMGLIQKGIAILYLSVASPFIDPTTEKWMFYTHPYHEEKFMVVEEIHKDIIRATNQDNVSNILNCFNFNFSIIFSFILANLFSFLMLFLLKLLLSNRTNNSRSIRRKRKSIGKKIKKILRNYLKNQWNLDYSKLTTISIFILSYSLYIWFVQLIISNNINTEKVIVDQSIIIKDENDALRSKKTVCFLENQLEMELVLSSNSNILSKLYYQKNILSMPLEEIGLKNGDKCIIKDGIRTVPELDGLFIILAESMVFAFFSMANRLKEGLVIFFNKNPIAEMNQKFVIKNEQSLIDIFDRISLFNTQYGLAKKAYDITRVNSHAFLQSNTVYRTIEDFVNGNSKFSDLNTESFRLLFMIYLVFCLIILIINVLHCSIIKIQYLCNN